MIQHLEQALSHSITIKKDVKHPIKISKKEAEIYLKKNQLLTLGQAIRLAQGKDLYSDTLYRNLKALLEERNWLIHNFVHHHLDDMLITSEREQLFLRIKSISNDAKTLQRAIEYDLIEYSESVGMNMSRIRVVMNQIYPEL